MDKVIFWIIRRLRNYIVICPLAISYNPKLIKRPQMRLANLFGKIPLQVEWINEEKKPQSFNWQTLLKEQCTFWIFLFEEFTEKNLIPLFRLTAQAGF